MKVCEIFNSIQGESTYAGVPCTFVRMSGCNLRCTYCDTTYAYGEGMDLSEGEIVEEIRKAGFRTVAITGGEPLLQAGVLHLVEHLLDQGCRVLIETNGSQDTSGIDKRAVVVLDVKTPGSGMSGAMHMSNLSRLKRSDEVKFVLTGREDYEWSRDMIAAHSLLTQCVILFSPAFGILDPVYLARWILDDRLEVRLNLQMHKYLYGPYCRGV
jgi:7-carboxy-7-deazaguanine synthase